MTDVPTQSPRKSNAEVHLATVAALSAIIWVGNFAVGTTSAIAAGGPGASPMIALARFLVACFGFLMSLGVHLVMRRYTNLSFWQRFVRTLGVCVPVAGLVTFYSGVQFTALAPPEYVIKSLFLDFLFSIAFYLWIYTSWAALYAGLYAVRSAEEQARRVAEMEARAHEAQLSALRYQLNPHFFFNVLNTLSGLISRQRLADAERVIVGMGEFLRYSLNGAPTQVVTLRDEVAAQKTYLDIEKVRFGDRLVVDISVPPECEPALVPALILQPLVENAVKHGVARTEQPTIISIGAKREGARLTCWVENDVAASSAPKPAGFGVGLRNVAERLRTLYGEAAAFDAGLQDKSSGEKSRWRASIELPFVERRTT